MVQPKNTNNFNFSLKIHTSVWRGGAESNFKYEADFDRKKDDILVQKSEPPSSNAKLTYQPIEA